MSEFKFSCPNCQQNIQATSEYSGHQVNCPSCQTLLVVPAAPDAPAAPAPAPSGPRLSMAASTPHAQPPMPATSAASMANARPTRKKKPKAGLIAGLALGTVAVAALIYFWPDLMKKVSHGNVKLAEEQAATNAPPPPPPELTTEEILQKVSETYKGLTDYAAKAQTVGDIDMTALAIPGKKLLRTSTTSTLQLGRTNFYRLEWEQKADGKTVEGAAWNSGKGNFVGYGPIPPSKVKTRELALAPAAASFLLSGGIAELFFSDTNSFAEMAKDFTKTNGPSPTGKECYVLTGEVNHQGAVIWIDKISFLIVQLEGILGGTIDEAELKKLPSSQRGQAAMLAKLKGSVTETYTSIQTNQNLMASAFETAFKPAGNTAVRGKRPAPTPGSMANPRRQRGQPPQ
jgi:hypothetical protein